VTLDVSSEPIAVVSILEALQLCATRFLPAPTRPPVRGAGRIYFLFSMRHRIADEVYADPSDGVVFVDLHHFENEVAARSWIHADIKKRSAA
jgi:hypothetical protein